MFEKSKNEKSRKLLLEKVKVIKKNKNSLPVIDLLNRIEHLLSNDMDNNNKKTIKLDATIIKMLQQIEANVKNDDTDDAYSECREVVEKVRERNELANVDEDLFGNKTKLDSQLKRLQNRKEEINRELNRLDLQSERRPDDDYLENQIEDLEDELDFVESRIELYRDSLTLIKSDDRNKDKVGDTKKVKGMMPTYEQLDVNQAKADEADDAAASIADRADAVRDKRNAQSAARAADRAAKRQARADRRNTGASSGVSYGSGSLEDRRLAREQRRGSRNSGSASSSGGSIDAIYAEADQMLADIEYANEEYEEKINETDRNLKRVSNMLVELLTRRKTATAAECVKLDSDIRSLKSKYVSYTERIKAFSQAKAYNDELRITISSAVNLNDVQEIKSLVNRNSAFLKDPEAAALAIKAMKEQNNSELAHMSEINAVIGGTEIDDSTLSSGRISSSDIGSMVKDDDAFADLEQALGLRGY